MIRSRKMIYMKFFIFCLLISFYPCSSYPILRFNGTLTRENENPITVSGTSYRSSIWGLVTVYIYAMDYSTMTPFLLEAQSADMSTENWNEKLNCLRITYGLESRRGLVGILSIKQFLDGVLFNAECYTGKDDRLVFKSFNVRVEKVSYSQKEAGFRAKFLIDQPTSKYKPYNVLHFARLDYPYLVGDCNEYLRSFYPVAPGPEPGAFMVGTDGKHCAIVDNEGTKFIQSNPAVGKVTYDSIAVAQRYFPNGIIYKRYPE